MSLDAYTWDIHVFRYSNRLKLVNAVPIKDPSCYNQRLMFCIIRVHLKFWSSVLCTLYMVYIYVYLYSMYIYIYIHVYIWHLILVVVMYITLCNKDNLF